MFDKLMRAALLPAALLAFTSPVAAEDDAFPRGLLPETVTPVRYQLQLAIDPRADGFSGTTSIEVSIEESTRRIWLHGLDLTEVEAQVEAGGRSVGAVYTEVDAATGVARLDLEQEVAPGPAVLRFRYRGAYRQGSEGLFLIETGGERYVFSQLEAIDARRVFPGFDQPGFKTPFDITVIAAEGDTVVTNTPLVASQASGDGRVTHRFATTLPLPTYLLAFAVGPLDVVDAPVLPPNGVRDWPLPLRGIATRGNGPKLAFALANTRHIVGALEDYFGRAFPYPKLDLIATPSLGGAMENAGAIVYDESILFVDENSPTTALRSFAMVHAHELAHQWFGDLVTPWWWEDTWLNESFATWLGQKIAVQWRPVLYNAADLVSGAFRVMDGDSRVAGRPVREPIDDNLRISSTFDGLTYSKGGGLLRMFESFLGEDRFRDGVRLHVNRHVHGVATSDEFFAAMAEASGQPTLVESFRDFVTQPGVPIVTVAISEDGRHLALSQSRYGPIGVEYPAQTTWKIPFCVTVYGLATPEKVCTLFDGKNGRLDLPPGITTFMPNAGGAGYYRFAMEPDDLAGLIDIAADLPPPEALALVDSVAAAFRAGRLPFDSLVSVARQLATYPDRRVALALSNQLLDIQSRWSDAAERQAIAALIVDIYGPRLDALGLDPSAGAYASDDPGTRLLRLALTELLAFSGNHPPTLGILADAARRSLEDAGALDAEFRQVAWGAGVRAFGRPFAEKMVDRVVTSPDPRERIAASAALGVTTDPEIAAMAFQLMTEPEVRALDMYNIVLPQLGQPETRERAWSWLLANFRAFTDRLPGFAQEMSYSVPSSICDAGLRDSAANFLDEAIAERRTSSFTAARTLESIDLCIAQKAALGGQVREVLGIAGGVQ